MTYGKTISRTYYGVEFILKISRSFSTTV